MVMKEEDLVEKYLDKNFRNLSTTKYNYRVHIKQYFQFLDIGPNTYFNGTRNYQDDVANYWQYLMKIYAPKSIPPKLSAIKYFLEANDVEFKARFWKQLSKRGLGQAVVHKDRIPTVGELKQIITMADVKDRAFLLMMLSSGIRPAELGDLKIGEIDLTVKPAKITILGTTAKNKQERTTFITGEASNALEAWLKVRNNYMEQNIKRFKGLRGYLEKTYKKEINDKDVGRIFPFPVDKVRIHYNEILEKLGGKFAEKHNGRYVLHFYTLRKFFNTRLKKVIPEHIVKKLMGHEGYLNSSYDRYTEQELATWYSKCQSQLYVLEAPANQDDVEHVRAQMKKLQSQVSELLKQTQWYKQRTVDGEPIMSDKEAIDTYEQDKKTIDEIKEKSPEIWQEEQMKKLKAEKWKRKHNIQND